MKRTLFIFLLATTLLSGCGYSGGYPDEITPLPPTVDPDNPNDGRTDPSELESIADKAWDYIETREGKFNITGFIPVFSDPVTQDSIIFYSEKGLVMGIYNTVDVLLSTKRKSDTSLSDKYYENLYFYVSGNWKKAEYMVGYYGTDDSPTRIYQDVYGANYLIATKNVLYV